MNTLDRSHAGARTHPRAHGFGDRTDAGRVLAGLLSSFADRPDVVVLALPRGGVPVAFEIASALRVPLDILVVKKIGVPGYEELALGAAASGGLVLIDEELARHLDLPKQTIAEIVEQARHEVERREAAYRNHRPPPVVQGRTVILVDDGLATGSSMQAAVQALRRERPAAIVVAVPVAAPEAAAELAEMVDEVVCAQTPDPFFAVGAWYEDFSQTQDDEVRRLLEHAAQRGAGS